MSTTATTRIENRTPHEIVLLRPRVGAWDNPDAAACPDGHFELCRLPSLGEARASAIRRKAGEVETDTGPLPIFGETDQPFPGGWLAPIFEVEFGPVTGLPEPEPAVWHIVSRVAAEAARAQGRRTDDLLIPDGLVRGPNGQPIGCTGFARL